MICLNCKHAEKIQTCKTGKLIKSETDVLCSSVDKAYEVLDILGVSQILFPMVVSHNHECEFLEKLED